MFTQHAPGGQGLVFAVVGFAAGIVGTATSNGLLAVRQALDKNFESQNEAPNVLLNAGTWATHMGISSNIRYQILNGIDMVRALDLAIKRRVKNRMLRADSLPHRCYSDVSGIIER